MSRLYINPPTVLSLKERYVDRLEALGLELVWNETGQFLTEADVLAQTGDATAIIGGADPYTAQFFQQAKHLRVLAKYGVGYDNVDVEAAEKAGIPVTVTAGSNADSVAEYAIAAMLALRLGLPAQTRAMLAGQWIRTSHRDITGTVLGIVGTGRIGSRVAARAKALGMKVIASDPLYDDPAMVPGVDAFVDERDLVHQADIITLHCPKTETSPVFARQHFEMMKPGCIIINMARGGMVVERDLADALRSGHLLGAALDVFEDEPPAHKGLWDGCDNLILTPHTGGSSEGAIDTGFEMTIEVLEHYFGHRHDRPRSTHLTQPGR